MKFETFENRTHSPMSPKELIKYNTNEYENNLLFVFFLFWIHMKVLYQL